MKKRFNIIISLLACGIILASCGGGSGKSGLKKNQYLGSLPAIYADYNLEKETHEAKMKEKGQKLIAGGEKNSEKIMKLMMEEKEIDKLRKEKLNADVNAEIVKIAGKEIPVSYSKTLLDSNELFYDVAPVKSLDDKYGNIALAIILLAKSDFEVPRMKGYDYVTYFRLMASDGSTITKSVLLPIKVDLKTLSFTAGQQLMENNFSVYIKSKPELYANFTGIEFITKDEYNEYNESK